MSLVFYTNVALNAAGSPLPGASVTVMLPGSSVPVVLYADAKWTPAVNPAVTESDGTYSFWITAGSYKLSILGVGTTTPILVENVHVGTTSWYSDNLLRYLPNEFSTLDVDGSLREFLEVVAISMDDFDTFIREFTEAFDVDRCEPRFLPYLAKLLNYQLSERDTVASQRLQLKYAVEWYKRKGLAESFRILFYSLGYLANLVELWTRDYKTFSRYPGSWQPPIFLAKVSGTSDTRVTITYATRSLLLRVDGGAPIPLHLAVGEGRLLTDVAAEIDAVLEPHSADCLVSSGRLVIQTRLPGANSSIRVMETENAAYPVLGLSPTLAVGIDTVVPDDWPELQENGGKWYKSPHFGVEVFSIKDYVLDADEFDYVRERIELVRPAHTVFDFLDYVKALDDQYLVSESNVIGVIEPHLVDSWPLPICIDRGKNCTIEYRRDGFVPDRSEETRVRYQHLRLVVNKCVTHGTYHYTYTLLSRASPSGPDVMPDRGVPRYFRHGYPDGLPKRNSCSQDSEALNLYLAFSPQEPWGATFRRDGGAKYRNLPDTYFRDGSFSRITSRNPFEVSRSGGDTVLSRGGNPPFDSAELLYSRPDLPNVFFRSLEAMNDPIILGIIEQLPGPGESGPGLG